jgi:hypothetical protein
MKDFMKESNFECSKKCEREKAANEEKYKELEKQVLKIVHYIKYGLAYRFIICVLLIIIGLMFAKIGDLNAKIH